MDIMNPEAMEAEKEHLLKVFKHYGQGPVKDRRIRFIPGIPYAGEFFASELLAKRWGMANVQKAVLDRMQLFADQGQELWTFFHPAHKNVGNEWIPYNDIASRFAKDHKLNRVLWTFFTCDGTQAKLGPDAYRYWVGADYAKRVVNAASRARQWGVHGLLMSPRADEGPVTPEIVSEMAKAIRILNE